MPLTNQRNTDTQRKFSFFFSFYKYIDSELKWKSLEINKMKKYICEKKIEYIER